MEISYDVVPDDLLEFQLQHMANSPTVQRNLRNALIAGSVAVPAFAAMGVYAVTGSYAAAVLAAALGLATWVLYWWALRPAEVRGQVSRMLKEGRVPGNLGRHVLSAEETGLVETSESCRLELAWPQIERVVRTPTLLLLYFGAVQAIVIPRRAFGSDAELASFETHVRDRMGGAKGS